MNGSVYREIGKGGKSASEWGLKSIERIVLSFIGEATSLSLYLSPFSPLFLWKSMAAKLWEGRLRPKGNYSQFDRSQASFLPSRACRFEATGEQPCKDALDFTESQNLLLSNQSCPFSRIL